MNFYRRHVLKAVVGLLPMTAMPKVFAQTEFPNNVIKFVIPSAVGGGYDMMMRVVGNKLTEVWKQPTIVESKAGAAGAIAAAAVARAPADGYTVLINYSSFLSNIVRGGNIGYKLEDFAPVCMMVLAPIAIGVRSSLGVKTLKEFVELAKSKPGKISYGSYGPASGGNFVGELLNEAAGIDTIHVAYKGEAPAIQDLLGGQIDSAITSIGAVSRHPGKIVPLAVSNPTRFPAYDYVPTFIESGYPTVDMPGWGGTFVPRATPKPIVDKLSAELRRAIMLPDVSQKMLEAGFQSAGWDSEKFSSFLQEQLVKIKRLVDSGRIKF